MYFDGVFFSLNVSARTLQIKMGLLILIKCCRKISELLDKRLSRRLFQGLNMLIKTSLPGTGMMKDSQTARQTQSIFSLPMLGSVVLNLGRGQCLPPHTKLPV